MNEIIGLPIIIGELESLVYVTPHLRVPRGVLQLVHGPARRWVAAVVQLIHVNAVKVGRDGVER